MAEHIDLEKVKKTLDNLIETLRDGHEGFTELGERLKDPTARRFFLEELQVRSNFAGELENELHRLGVKDVHVSTSVSSKAHRGWGELKAKLGGGDYALLDTAEQGEDAAKKSYAEALEQDLPVPVRELVAGQQAHILKAHDRVKSLRDSLKKTS
jgi:uncharacterized protein (TIGR02284 family)